MTIRDNFAVRPLMKWHIFCKRRGIVNNDLLRKWFVAKSIVDYKTLNSICDTMYVEAPTESLISKFYFTEIKGDVVFDDKIKSSSPFFIANVPVTEEILSLPTTIDDNEIDDKVDFSLSTIEDPQEKNEDSQIKSSKKTKVKTKK